MAITFKVFLDERRKKKDQKYPLKIRLTIDRKHREFHFDIRLEKIHWDAQLQRVKHTHPNYKLLQLKISKKLAELQENTLTLENQGKVFSVNDISSSLVKKQRAATFLSFGREQIETLLRSGRVGNSIAYSCAVNKVEKFVGEKHIRFEDINYRFLEEFTASMSSEGLKPNAIASYMREIRAIYNKAIKMELVEAKYYPFLKYKIRTEKTINRALTLEEMTAIAEVDLTANSNHVVYQSLFLLSFCLIGINFADLLTLKSENLINDRVVFHRKKTAKVYSIKLHEKAKELFRALETERKNIGCYLLPFVNSNDTPVKQKNNIALIIHATNENLKTIASSLKINKAVSTYYARYSWANIAKSLGYSKDLIAEALGHEYGNKITGIYLDDYDKEVVDEMNNKVINTVFKIKE